MEKEKKNGPMVINFLEFLCSAKKKEKVDLFLRTEMFTRATLWIIYFTVKVNINGQMVAFIMENGSSIKWMAKEFIHIKMEANI